MKVLSLLSERQTAAAELQGRNTKAVPSEEIILSVSYLLNKQQKDGSFKDRKPVLHRDLSVNSFLVCLYRVLCENVLKLQHTEQLSF